MKPLLTLALVVILDSRTHSQDTESFLPINGTELRVKTLGNGSPIIVLHGGPGLNYSYFLPQISDLAKRHRVILFDQRASGKSSADLDSTQMTLDMMTDDIDAIRKHFKYEKVNILAHSFGGLLAMKYAIKYPLHLDRMILVSSIAPKAGEFGTEVQRATRKKITKADSLAGVAIRQSDDFKAGKGDAVAKLLMLTFKPGFHHPAYADSVNLVIDDDFMTKRKTMFLLMNELNSYDLYPELSKIKAPTLIIHGASDTTPEALSIKMQQAIKGSKRVTIERAGHWAFVERRSEFSSVVLKFVR
jgi:proline iminopeptidase